MKIGERGQVTIPKELRDRFGLVPSTEVEFVQSNGELILRRKTRSSRGTQRRRWVGYLNGEPEDVDTFIEAIRGR